MSTSKDDDARSLNVLLSHGITRRKLLKGLAGLAALGLVAPACQTSQQPSSPTPSKAATPVPATGPAASPAASPVAKSISLAKRRPMKINWTAVSGTMSGLWIAQETGAWKELGIDSELVHIPSSSRVVAAFEAREIEGAAFDWVVAVTSLAAGGSGRIVAGMTNRTVFSVVGAKGINKPEDAKGKRWGITRIGSGTHSAALLAMDIWGFKASDVNFMQLQEVPAILSALEAGQVDVGIVSPPTNTRAIKAGFKELINLGNDGPEYPSIGLGTTQDLINNSPDVVRALVAGYAEGVRRFRNDPELAIQVLKKYLGVDDREMLVDTQKQFSTYLAWPPVVPLKAAEKLLADVAKTEPKAASIKVDQVATNRFIEELDKDGFFK